MHGKEEAFAGAIECATSARVVTAPGIDTDRLGTFTGEVERPGTMRETAIAKARLGMRATGLTLGIANEGSFGPHPSIGFIPVGIETAVFVDDEEGFICEETLVSECTNFAHLDAKPGDDLSPFLARVQFPSHALIVRSIPGHAGPPILMKGLRSVDSLTHALESLKQLGSGTVFRIETDMRAHMNPTRMNVLRDLAARFASRIATPCPACKAPGFGPAAPEAGLPCEYCGTPTALARNQISACTHCSHRTIEPRRDGRTKAPQMNCPQCNP
jgi:hypothetical protein